MLPDFLCVRCGAEDTVSILTRRLGRMLRWLSGPEGALRAVSILTRRLGRMLHALRIEGQEIAGVSILTRRLGRMLLPSVGRLWFCRKRFQSSPGG